MLSHLDNQAGGNVDSSKYQEARLNPDTGVKGDQDKERRATGAFLATLVAVPGAVSAIDVTADLRANQVLCQVRISARSQISSSQVRGPMPIGQSFESP